MLKTVGLWRLRNYVTQRGTMMRRKYRNNRKWNATPTTWKRPKRKPPVLLLAGAAFVTATVGTQAYYSGWFTGPAVTQSVGFMSGGAASAGERISFSNCHTGGGYNCVVDGDTIWLRGDNIRLADIDTPETHDFQCQSEKELGDRATTRLKDLLESGSITLEPIDRDQDPYGRLLRIVLIDGESVGTTLVEEGLARWYEGGRRPWC